jgi:general secretion pathway protein M
MKERWVKLQEWWLNLALREKQAVALGGLLLGLFILYQFIWTPYLNQITAMRTRIQTEQKTLRWMQAADKEISKLSGQSKNKSQSITPVIVLGLLQKQINHVGLEQNLTQLKQATNESIELHFQKVVFDKLITFLTSVIKEQSVSIAQLSVSAENTPGIVNADIILKL